MKMWQSSMLGCNVLFTEEIWNELRINGLDWYIFLKLWVDTPLSPKYYGLINLKNTFSKFLFINDELTISYFTYLQVSISLYNTHSHRLIIDSSPNSYIIIHS